MRRLLGQLSLMLALAMASAGAWADVYVIVNAGNAIHALSNKDTVDLFMGRTRTYANGDYVLACDLPRDSATRVAFYQTLTGMTQAQLNSYWSRLMFTGRVMPPQMLQTEQSVLDMVKRNPGAIGYVGQEPQDKGVRVVLTLKEGR
ncbi:MAG: hypothetical protein KGL57_07825 [Burkholderiales bacterium]|nr:hypothetical protein [Burkholderiales bacterium]